MNLKKRAVKGFTLLECMIACTLGLFLLVILIQQYQLLLHTEILVQKRHALLDQVRLFRQVVKQTIHSVEAPIITIILPAQITEHKDIPRHIKKQVRSDTPVVEIKSFDNAQSKWLHLRSNGTGQASVLFVSDGHVKHDSNAVVSGIDHWEVERLHHVVIFKVTFAHPEPVLQTWEFCYEVQ